MNNLVRLPYPARNHGHRIFQRNAWDCGIQKSADKSQRLFLFALFFLEPSRPTDGQMRARRVGNHQVPTLIQHVANVALDMLARPFRRQQVTGPRIRTTRRKRITDDAAKLTSD
jgi:hypothetical protein